MLVWLSAAGAARAQVRVTGTVSDADTRKPVPRATVLLQGKGQGVIASDQGDFSLNATARDTLVFQALGVQPVAPLRPPSLARAPEATEKA